MIGHQAVGQQLQRLGREGMSHNPLEGGEIFVLVENLLASHSAVEDMEHDAGRSLSSGARHGEQGYDE
jgi:hypothetical protein